MLRLVSRRKKQQRQKPSSHQRRDLPIAELVGIIERAKTAPLSEVDCITLKTAVEPLTFLTQELAAKGTTLERLRKMLFGGSTEKTSQVVGGPRAPGARASHEEDEPKPKPRPAGHDRHGAAAYLGADKVNVPHASLQGGCGCPGCQKGTVYSLKEPAVLLRIQGMAPLGATLYEKERFRCNLCGEIYTAASPPGVGDEKYDATAASMIGLLKYGA